MKLSQKINLIVFFGIFFTFIISISLSFILIKKITYKKFIQKINLIGNEISKTSTISILLHDKNLIKNRVESYSHDRDISGIYIFDNKRNIIYSIGEKTKKFVIFPIILNYGVNNLEKNFSKKIGEVKIYYTESYLEKEIFNIFIAIFIIMALGLGTIVIVIYYVLNNALTIPLKQLMDLIATIKKGEFNIKSNIKASPEIVEVAETLKDLAESLNQKNIELKRSYELMAEHKTLAELGKFAMVVAHEIKNPLGIIKGASQIFKKENIDTETKLEMLQFIEEEVERLDNLVKDFMAISKSKEPYLKEIDIKNFLENLVEKLKLMFSNVKIIANINCSNLKKIDDVLLSQILTNLIKNSVEANANKIEISCFEKDKKWVIKIKDNGKGISKEELNKIFEPFYTNKEKGTGLGLVIVKNYVKLLNGFINVKSEIGKGTEFQISFQEAN